MYVDAEDRLAEMDDLNESDGMLFKIRTTRGCSRSASSSGRPRSTSCRS
jgi:hypothetical protein